jgi:hypothetical protein
MPRVNRDLQRRLAARRARERRRGPAERRYRFAPTPRPDEAVDGLGESGPAHRPAGADSPAGRAATSVGRAGPARPFSAYRAEYAYVLSDLRRIALVVGVLLVMLAVLWGIVIPR